MTLIKGQLVRIIGPDSMTSDEKVMFLHKVTKITEEYGSNYKLKIDAGQYTWNSDWLRPAGSTKMRELKKELLGNTE